MAAGIEQNLRKCSAQQPPVVDQVQLLLSSDIGGHPHLVAMDRLDALSYSQFDVGVKRLDGMLLRES
jgi:hypothetical protein